MVETGSRRESDMRTSLLALLRQLEARAATGRVVVRGMRTGWVYVHGGRIYCVERDGEPSLFDSMESAGLFGPGDLDLALRVPVRDRWRLLVHGDEARLDAVRAFARLHAADQLRPLLAPVFEPSFTPRIEHPLGPVGAWSVDELLGVPPSGEEVVDIADGTVVDARRHDTAPADDVGRR